MANSQISRHGEYDVTVSDRGLNMNLPQKLGVKLWVPMLLMAVMAFPVAFILGAIRADLVATGTTISDAANAAALGQYVTGIMFLGFASAFAAIVFAIARILGVLRTGGGQIQEAAGRRVLTLRMPGTAKAMIVLMMMALMMLLFSVVAHVVLGVVVNDAVLNAKQGTIDTVGSWTTWLEGIRRFGATVYLVSISLGLATIIHVLRFQSSRVRELPEEAALLAA
ncbi:MAG: hypothetical protein V3S37_05985 [Dehalococcoidia bacterium]